MYDLTRAKRLPRMKFLIYTLLYVVIINLIIGAVIVITGIKFPEIVWYLIMMVLYIWLVAQRRVQDMWNSSWWAGLLLIPLVNIGLLLVFLFQPGQKSTNKFGPPN